MDTNITFRIDSEIKSQMTAICSELGITTSTAFNIFARAFVRSNGMPFPVTIEESEVQESVAELTQNQMLADADSILDEFSADYERMAK